jgi:hypothetical protein
VPYLFLLAGYPTLSKKSISFSASIAIVEVKGKNVAIFFYYYWFPLIHKIVVVHFYSAQFTQLVGSKIAI